MLYKILFGLIYTIGYFLLALLNTGGGHGNFYLFSPFLPWFLIILAIALLGKLNNLTMRVFFGVAMLMHYVTLIIILMNYNFLDDEGWTHKSAPAAPLIWYLLGQIIIWLLYYSEIIKVKKPTEF